MYSLGGCQSRKLSHMIREYSLVWEKLSIPKLRWAEQGASELLTGHEMHFVLNIATDTLYRQAGEQQVRSENNVARFPWA
jgi:hypothetical protein